MSLRVGIDYTAAVRQGAGIGRYTRNLIRAVAEQDEQNQYTLLVAGGWVRGDGLGEWPSNFRVRPVPVSERLVRILWHRLRLPVPVQAFAGPIDLFHSPDFVLPPCGGVPTLLTVHDLSFLRTPKFFVPEFRKYLGSAVARSARRAHHILVDSQSTGQDLVDCLSIATERITVLYPGVEARFRPIQDRDALERVRSRYDLPQSFVLGLGTLQPRKNFEGLIRGFQRLLESWSDGRGEEERLHLVIGGAKGWMFEDIVKLIHSHEGLMSRVHLIGFVDDEDLPALYSLAKVFAFPSWYEGFGLPVVEAMACGTPVVAANNSSLPEAVGDAGLLVDAADSEALAQALHQLLTSSELADRLIVAGLEQAGRFTWNSSARQLLRIYEALAAPVAGNARQ